jgi:dTDP-4-amino-4,6-dideoxygalactose transaminase
VPFVDLAASQAPYRDELLDTFDRVMTSGTFIGGDEVEAFEGELAAYVGTSHAIGVNSGTVALHLALVAAGIGVGDEVILPPNTFIATAEAVVSAGATPVFADVDINTGLLDAAAVEAAVGPRTAAIIAVHLHGQPADMAAMRAVADRHGLFLIEDAAQAIGGRITDDMVGTFGDAAAFSFYPAKNLGALGDAGAVVTFDEELARRVRLLRSHGEQRKNQHVAWGWTERLDTLQAAFLRVKLRHLDRAQRLRDAAVERYNALLNGQPGIALLATNPGNRHVHHHLVVRVAQRDDVLAELGRRGVGAAVHYPTPIHLQPVFGGRPDSFPNAEALARSILSLPLFPGITVEQIDRVVRALVATVADAGGAPGAGVPTPELLRGARAY